MSRSQRFVVFAVVLAASLLGGCSTYKLQGRIVDGQVSYISVVDASDPRLVGGYGLEGATLELWTDPDRINRKRVAQGVSDGDGYFELPVDEIGAGLLEYDVGLNVRRHGYAGTQQTFRLPPQRRRVLVVLRRGDGPRDTEVEDLMEEYRRFNR
ncbi:MAG: hypothetical protein EA379_09320 [Phycisphaerales bacterium]|nr:MAG: hypothetical protein EA379_09320 [Phycisphaerales bacterium]